MYPIIHYPKVLHVQWRSGERRERTCWPTQQQWCEDLWLVWQLGQLQWWCCRLKPALMGRHTHTFWLSITLCLSPLSLHLNTALPVCFLLCFNSAVRFLHKHAIYYFLCLSFSSFLNCPYINVMQHICTSVRWKTHISRMSTIQLYSLTTTNFLKFHLA